MNSTCYTQTEWLSTFREEKFLDQGKHAVKGHQTTLPLVLKAGVTKINKGKSQ